LLIRSAANAGANAVKFQAVFAEELATENYQHFGLFTKLEMTREDWFSIASCCEGFGIELQLDVFGAKSVALAEDLKIGAIKVHPTDMTNVALLKLIRETAIPKVLLGIGGANPDEISRAVELLTGKQIILLLGFQGYPTKTYENQIGRLRSLNEIFRGLNPALRLGFADHALPEEGLHPLLAALAVGFGSSLIEKHICLNRVLELEDHESAINADEFKLFCEQLRELETAIGVEKYDGEFLMSSAEKRYREMIRRDVVALKSITEGSIIGEGDIGLKRTGFDLAAKNLELVIGKNAVKNYGVDDVFLSSDYGSN
jgi:N,N'-diacetyllegionaminate synthase